MCVLFEVFFVVLLSLLLSDEPNDKSDRSKWSMMCWCDVIFWPWHQLFFPSLLFSRRTDFLSLLFFFFSLFEMWTGPIKASFKLEIRFDSIRFPFEFEWLNQSGLCVWVRAWDVKRINWLETRFDLTGLDWSWFDWTGLDWKFLIDWLIVGFTMWTPRKNKYGTVLGTNTGLLVGVYVCVRVCGCLLICGYTRCTNDNESDSIRFDSIDSIPLIFFSSWFVCVPYVPIYCCHYLRLFRRMFEDLFEDESNFVEENYVCASFDLWCTRVTTCNVS